MKIILGTKEKMSQVFGEDGKVYPITIIKAGPVVVTQLKNKDKDGYEAVQVGFGEKKSHKITKSQKGHFKDLGNFRFVKEFRTEINPETKIGTKLDASSFAVGDVVTISSFSKGKGFQGVVKRHGFAGGQRTHGQKHSEREPGSIGGGARAGGRVAKGMRMGGRMGGDRVTIRNVKIVQVNPESNEILVKGGVPGRRGTLVEIVGKISK
ncbi:MAG TPA: 50S ribosomal protein L3 [Candidatus Paceibacterota bacterium]|nr:50S ribosomal protein L3 [Candidatus Paceibacterota bacterium]HMP19199.1 50S ribosomal protein L3 [Candidatus Paceibacterota bacterium]HMP85270.1 50S ribosomal protein L3 [Candidatus Paceibacterota bacterium]